MRNPPFAQVALLLALVASGALAREPGHKVVIRTLLVSEHPARTTPNLYVSGQVATVLRFEQNVDPEKTRLLAWEGRFEPLLVGGKKVVIEPLRDLHQDEGVPLLVTLADGTELPFLVQPPWRKDDGPAPFTDHQVNVFKDRKSYDAVLSSLYDSLNRERELSEENERLKQEENSVDHAYATLLLNGEVKKTPFRQQRMVVMKNEDMVTKVEVFSGPGKAAVVIHLTNMDARARWTFARVQLTSESTYTDRPFALRMNRADLAPGQSGKISVVVDKSAFESEKGGLVDLALQLFREDGLMHVAVPMDRKLLRN
ncbi:DUF2381 family protein [Pyxidicoccus fallax]|uniref:DUF2381 family protein n=1 Tax=Pyxidicoccus fallax TaxID=394095 RepID=A0A848L455_9BACT|nr:DUF2381 family protein [Pyxidicoccus fallax]NMO13409.1 DUF2381 family protein [Pyxidicoccus fallax]NPC80318.1 DUF2381 family protein [Pyxidicoccus fallax]